MSASADLAAVSAPSRHRSRGTASLGVEVASAWRLGPSVSAYWTGLRRECLEVTARRCTLRSVPDALALFAGLELTWSPVAP